MVFSVLPLAARGKKEESKPEPLNTEFTLCITAFNVSALPPSQQVLGPILQRELVKDLSRIHYRRRTDDELFRYEELAWTRAMHEAAAKLAEKRAERDGLLYQGVPGWKYRKEIKRIHRELAELEEAFAKAEAERPLIAGEPLFRISTINTGADPSSAGEFPLPPPRGGEEVFLKNHNADALLSGNFRYLYGRIYAEFRLFSRGSSFLYEDSTIFSPDDLTTAADELKLRFLTALANSEPARLVLYTDPEEAWILVNGRPARSGEVLELSPGPVRIEVDAEEYQGVDMESELEGAEEAEYSVILWPYTMENLRVLLPGKNTSVYMGALFIGGSNFNVQEETETETETVPEQTVEDMPKQMPEDIPEDIPEATETETVPEQTAEDTPEQTYRPGFFTLNIPVGQYRYIRIDTEDGLTGEAIVRGTELEDGEVRIVTLEPRKLPGRDDKPVEVKRRKFYGAYGRFWITLPLAFFINGVSQAYTNSYNSSGSAKLYDPALRSYYISIGAWAVAGIFLAESLIRMGIYVHTATKESIPLWE
jgi:hypothetical protein